MLLSFLIKLLIVCHILGNFLFFNAKKVCFRSENHILFIVNMCVNFKANHLPGSSLELVTFKGFAVLEFSSLLSFVQK